VCGICGIVHSDRGKPVDEGVLRRMNETLRHRGPDGDGFYRDKGVGLAMKRLSIIDLETGDQPIFNERKTLAIVCNGEIYNYVELRKNLIMKGHHFSTHSDVEVIVHLYEDHGLECLTYLRGMFAFALWDKEKDQLFLARDRLGIKPLNYAFSKDRSFYFGSEIKAILIAGEIEREVDPYAMQDMLIYGYVLSPRTLFRNIHRLLPGHYLLYKKGIVVVEKYWDLNFPERGEERLRISENEWAEKLQDKFEETVRLHLRSDVPVGGWLSSGIDSSAVVSFMKKLSSDPVQTFSLAFEDKYSDEVSSRKTLNNYKGYEVPQQILMCTGDHFNLYPKTVWYEENPDTSGVHVLQMMLAQETAKNKFKVVLTGEGSDEIFGGYSWYRVDKLSQPFSWLPDGLKRLMLLGQLMPRWKPVKSQGFMAKRPIDFRSYADLTNITYPDVIGNIFSERINHVLHSNHKDDRILDNYKDLDALEPFERIQYIETKTRLVDWVTHGLDRISMSQSLEARVPFLDHELVELASQIPPGLKLRGFNEKYILRQAMKDDLPGEILRRRKFGLRAPLINWLKGPLPPFAEEAFSQDCLEKVGYFNTDYVSSMLSQHRSGKRNFTKPLMVILGVHVWHQLFMGQELTI